MAQKVDAVELKRGLKDVFFDTTESSDVIGDIGKLIYQGYDIHDLAENSSFEETVYLLMHGDLPTQVQLDEFDGALRAARDLPEQVYGIIENTKNAHPMDVLRTAVSALAAFDPDDRSSSPSIQKWTTVGKT